MAQTTAPTPLQPGRWLISKFGPPSVLTWEPFSSLPTAHDDLVLIRIITAGIAGPDNIQRAGGYPNARCQEPGFTPGYDFVGQVVGLGPAVPADSLLACGDRVTSMCMIGAYATHILLPVSEVIRLRPDDDPIKVNALPLNYMTAWGMLKRSGVHLAPGSSILIGSASGGVGTAVAQIVKAFNMQLTMIGTCSSAKFDFVRSLGVTPIDRKASGLAARVRELTGGRGVDVAFDAVGSEESLRNSHAATKDETGRVVVVGIMAEIAPDGSGMAQKGVDVSEILAQRFLPRMTFWGVDRDYYQDTRALWLEDFDRLLQKVRTGELLPHIGRLFRLSEAVEANQMLVSGVGVMGKMEFIVDADLARTYDL